MSSASSSPGRYIPPHLRVRRDDSSASSSSTQTRIPKTSSSANNQDYKSSTSSSAPARAHSRTPWSVIPVPDEAPRSGSSSRTHSVERQDPSLHTTQSAPARPIPPGPVSVSPTLHVFGDSFVGPFKLLEEDCLRVTTFKGASAKVRLSFLALRLECPS
jgi:hypothetical protein